MSDLVQLQFERCIDRRVAMPMNICPNRRVTVEVTPAAAIFQPRTFTRDKQQRLVTFGHPVTHLRKWMPDKRLIERHKIVGIYNFHVLIPITPTRAGCSLVTLEDLKWFSVYGFPFSVRIPSLRLDLAIGGSSLQVDAGGAEGSFL